MMYLAWGVMVPFGIGAARYTKGFKNALWLKLHMGLMYGAVAAMLVGLAFAVRSCHILTTSRLKVAQQWQTNPMLLVSPGAVRARTS
jgi:hypothetical protein